MLQICSIEEERTERVYCIRGVLIGLNFQGWNKVYKSFLFMKLIQLLNINTPALFNRRKSTERGVLLGLDFQGWNNVCKSYPFMN